MNVRIAIFVPICVIFCCAPAIAACRSSNGQDGAGAISPAEGRNGGARGPVEPSGATPPALPPTEAPNSGAVGPTGPPGTAPPALAPNGGADGPGPRHDRLGFAILDGE